MAEIIEGFNYNLIQQIHCHNAAANVVRLQKGTQVKLQKEMEDGLRKNLPDITGAWKVTWGPAVYKTSPNTSSGGPTNAWYAATDDKQKTCVVAVAGTAQRTLFAWLGNMDVGHIVPFDEWASKWTVSSIPTPPQTTWKPGDGRSLCARGTAGFVHTILGMASPGTAASPGTTLGSFLQKLQQSNNTYKIVFTGHSLGGAVSPALAYGLVQAKILQPKGVSVFPSAGPSPGNAVWNSSFSRYFPPRGSGYQVENQLLFNQMDIVPQAFSVDPAHDRNLPNILGKIYVKLPEKIHSFTQRFVDLITRSAKRGMPYAPLPGFGFVGSPGIPSNITSPRQFEQSLVDQHDPVYWTYIGIQDYVNRFKMTVTAQPGVESLPDAPDFDEDTGDTEETDAEIQQQIEEFEKLVAALESEYGEATN